MDEGQESVERGLKVVSPAQGPLTHCHMQIPALKAESSVHATGAAYICL